LQALTERQRLDDLPSVWRARTFAVLSRDR
jgi:hypothetical protein